MRSLNPFRRDYPNDQRKPTQDTTNFVIKEMNQVQESKPISTSNGDDYLTGTNRSDELFGGNGNDSIYGKQGKDKIDGGNGNDILYGDQGADNLLGQNGNDLLVGGSGADTIEGGRGDDILIGDSGKDTYRGGLGSDIFVLSLPGMNEQMDYEHENDYAEEQNFLINAFGDDTEAHSDTIMDFTPGIDKIALANWMNLNQVTWINAGTNDHPQTKIFLGNMVLGQLWGIYAEELSASDFTSFTGMEMT